MKRNATPFFIIQLLIFLTGTICLNAQSQVIASADATICEGTSAQLNATGVTTYSWAPATGLSCINCQQPIASPTVTTTYTVTGIKHVDAAVNGDFSAGNTGFTSTYIYDNVNLQQEGKYAVGTNPHDYLNGFTTTGDHTTGNGNYLIVNGATVPNVMVWSQTITVQPNKLYTFSCWGKSVYPTAPALLQFSINNANIGSNFSFTNSTTIWNNYTTTWYSGAATSATISILNMNTIAWGNDFGLDDISFWYPETSDDSVTVNVNPLPSVNFTSSSNTNCGSTCVTFQDETVIANPGTIGSWNWDFGDGNTSGFPNQQHCYTNPGSYTISLTVNSDSGCSATKTLYNYVNVGAGPQAVIGVDGTEKPISNPEFQFSNEGINYNTSQWNFGDGNTSTAQNPDHTYADTGFYVVQLIVMNSLGCSDTTYTTVHVELPWTLYMPNAFSPNGDGMNDVFAPVSTYIFNFRMRIFDRWGNLICMTNDIENGWDGTFRGIKCEAGVYVYSIDFIGNTGEEHTLQGSAILIR